VSGRPAPKLRAAAGDGSPRDFTPPPIETAEAVLRLLVDEARARWGEKADRVFIRRLSAKQTSMVRKTLLAPYDPDQITDMIRLLVWDWELARIHCRRWDNDPCQQKHMPSVDDLCFWHQKLVAHLGVGFPSTGAIRGRPESYHKRYIFEKPKPEPSDYPELTEEQLANFQDV